MKKTLCNLFLLLALFALCLFIPIAFNFCSVFMHNVLDYYFTTNSYMLIQDSPENYLINYSKGWSGLYNIPQSEESGLHNIPQSGASSCKSDNTSCLGLFPKKAIIKVFNSLKNNINNNTELVTHKLKVVDRTLSWFFKRSKPGGGRGL